jgi:hypothetical protein
MRSFVIIVFDPKSASCHCLLEAVELGTEEKLVLDAFPEPLNLAQCHGMVGAGFDMFYPVFFHFLFKPGLAPPVGVLPAVVRQHLFGHPILGNPPPVGL